MATPGVKPVQLAENSLRRRVANNQKKQICLNSLENRIVLPKVYSVFRWITLFCAEFTLLAAGLALFCAEFTVIFSGFALLSKENAEFGAEFTVISFGLALLSKENA